MLQKFTWTRFHEKWVNCDANKFLIFIYFYMLNSILNVCQAFNAKKQVKQLSKNFCLNVQKIHSRLLKRLPLAAGKPSYANECRATRAAGAQWFSNQHFPLVRNNLSYYRCDSRFRHRFDSQRFDMLFICKFFHRVNIEYYTRSKYWKIIEK